MRDPRGFRCGNIFSYQDRAEADSSDARFYMDPRAIIKARDPDVAARLDARLRGEPVQVYDRGPKAPVNGSQS